MKKFEEELKRPSNAGIDPFSKRDVSFEKLSNKFTKGAQTLKEWKEYAFKAEDRIRELESQLEKQQPEIPEFVATEIKSIDFMAWIGHVTLARFTARTLNWLEKNKGDMNIIEYIFKLYFTDFTVAKEKRFYLKNKFTGNYLSSVPESNNFYHIMVRDPKVNGLVRSFTQSEIDSMETGSYEQIEVEE